MSDPSELSMIYRFEIGEAYDDLAAVFAIDGRDYTDVAALRSDVREASDALERLRLIHEFETSHAGPGTPTPDLPSWPQWRDRHVIGSEPIGVRPADRQWSAPPGWADMGGWLETSHQWLRGQVADAAGSVSGGRAEVVADAGPTRVGPASVAPAEEQYAIRYAHRVVPPAGTAGPDVLQAISGWLRSAGWDVGEPDRRPDVTTVRATNAGYQITAVWRHDTASVMLLGDSPVVDAVRFARPGE